MTSSTELLTNICGVILFLGGFFEMCISLKKRNKKVLFIFTIYLITGNFLFNVVDYSRSIPKGDLTIEKLPSIERK